MPFKVKCLLSWMHTKKQCLLIGNANTTLKKYVMAVPEIQITSFTHPSLISDHYMSFFKLKYFLNCKEQPSVISHLYTKLRVQAFQKLPMFWTWTDCWYIIVHQWQITWNGAGLILISSFLYVLCSPQLIKEPRILVYWFEQHCRPSLYILPS